MRADVIHNLASHIDVEVVNDLLSAYEGLISKHRAGDAESALTRAGKFVEHAFRALECIRTGIAPSEIKSPSATARSIENDTSLPESMRLMVPRIALAMIYDVRSKRGAVHVKEIDPRDIDVTLAVAAASWVMAEFLRLYHVSAEDKVLGEMKALTRANIPFVEAIAGEVVVTQPVPADTEVLLLLADATPGGLTRTQLGKAAKCSAPSVTRTVQKLSTARLIHKTEVERFHISGTGEAHLADWLAAAGKWSSPT